MNHYTIVFVHKYDNFKCEMDAWADSELEAFVYASALPEVYQIIAIRPWKDIFDMTEEERKYNSMMCELIMEQLQEA